MSVDIGLELDLGLLVGEMEAPPCESPHHLDTESHDDGQATHYMRIGHSCYGPVGQVIPVCQAYVRHWGALGKKAWCAWCGMVLSEDTVNVTIGPINS